MKNGITPEGGIYQRHHAIQGAARQYLTAAPFFPASQ